MRETRPASKTRTVSYSYSGQYDESEVEKVLAHAKGKGFVTQYDSGTGTFLWFNGVPGEELRKLRARIETMIA